MDGLDDRGQQHKRPEERNGDAQCLEDFATHTLSLALLTTAGLRDLHTSSCLNLSFQLWVLVDCIKHLLNFHAAATMRDTLGDDDGEDKEDEGEDEKGVAVVFVVSGVLLVLPVLSSQIVDLLNGLQAWWRDALDVAVHAQVSLQPKA